MYFLFVVLGVLSVTRGYDYIRWDWSSGDKGGYNTHKTDAHYFGSRSGSAYFSGCYFGGLLFDTDRKQYVLKNDLWSGLHTVIHPGTDRGQNSNSVPAPRQKMAACGISGIMYVIFGGFGEKDEVLGDTWLFMYSQNKWINLSEKKESMNKSTSMPAARGDAAVWCLKDKLIVMGGIGKDGSLLADMWQFSLSELTWTPTKFYQQYNKTGLAKYLLKFPKPRSGGHTWVSRDQQTLHLFGGNIQTEGHRSSAGYMSDLWRYNVINSVWTMIDGPTGPGNHGVAEFTWKHSKKNYPGGRIGAATGTDYHGHLWLFGGRGATRDPSSVSDKQSPFILGDLWNYNIKMNQWALFDEGQEKGNYVERTVISKASWPRPRYNMIFDVSLSGHNRIWMYGGIGRNDENTQDVLLNDMWTLDLVNYNQYYYVMYPGTLFLMLFFSIGSVILVSVIFIICPSLKLKKLSKLSKSNSEIRKKLDSNEDYLPLMQE